MAIYYRFISPIKWTLFQFSDRFHPICDIPIDFLFVQLVEHLMSAAGIEFQRHIDHAALFEHLRRLPDTCAVAAHRVFFAGDEEHGQFLIHLIDIFLITDQTDTTHHITEQTQRGLSGGVTLWGFSASLLGAALIAAVYAIGTPNWKQILFIIACGFGGALLDSILGSLLQVKYRCPVCQMMTERKIHCGKPTEKIKGYEKITNDTVNFICNLSVGVLAAVLLLIGG